MSEDLRRKIAGRRRIYLLRHGEVSYFDRNGKPYPQHSVPLNAEGIVQAEAARETLLKVPIDRAFHTGFPRTRATAEIVLRGRGVQAEACEDLREITPGPFAKEAQGSAFESYFTGAFTSAPTRDTRFLGGESFGAFEDRVLPAFSRLIESPGWKHILLVAHGGTNRFILLHALGAGLHCLSSMEQEACCINVIDVHEGGRFLIRQLNFTPYSHMKERVWETTLERIYLDHFEGITSGGREVDMKDGR